MLFEKDKRNKIIQDDLKIKEISIRIERLEKECQELFDYLGLTPEQLEQEIAVIERHSPEVWKELQEQKEQMEEGLKRELHHIPDLGASKKKRSESRQVAPHWIFVR